MLTAIFPAVVIGLLTGVALVATTLLSFLLMTPLLLLKLLPQRSLRRACSRGCILIARRWVAANRLVLRTLHPVHWNIEGPDTALDPRANYLLIANHQSWADILLLLDLLHGRTPFPRFFLKWELMYVPVIGLACWGMDFPFMRRHSKAQIAARPALRSRDLEATRRACEIYRSEPVTVINFVEGTRFTAAKHRSGRSPLRHLLRPKAGGVAYTLGAMGEQFAGVIDVTIAYRPTRQALLWSFGSGQQHALAVHIDLLPVPEDLLQGDYENDSDYRERFQSWINGLWARKDARLERMLGAPPPEPAPRAAHF